MKIKSIVSSLLILGISTLFTPSASAYIDNLGRVFPGKKPTKHTVPVKTHATSKSHKISPKKHK